MSSFKVFLTRSDYSPGAVATLYKKYTVEFYPHPKQCPREELKEGVKGADALFCMSSDVIDKEVLDAAGHQLKIVSTMSIGYEHIDTEECKRRGIIVCNSPNDRSIGATAEMTVGLMLAAGRRFLDGIRAIERGQWLEAWDPEFCVGRGLMGSTVGIVGMGRVGAAVLKRILAFDVAEVIYYDVQHPLPYAEELGAKYTPFEKLLAKSDFIAVNCNLTPESRGMFSFDAFSRMKSNAVLVNTSRGPVVDLEALYEALKTKQIRAAALDVMYPEPLPKDHILLSLPNIVLLPHISAAEENGLKRSADVTAFNIDAVLQGRPTVTKPV